MGVHCSILLTFLCLSIFKTKTWEANPTSHSCLLPGWSKETRELTSGGGKAWLVDIWSVMLCCVLSGVPTQPFRRKN